MTTRAISQTTESISDGTVSGTPRLWLRLEAAALLTGALVAVLDHGPALVAGAGRCPASRSGDDGLRGRNTNRGLPLQPGPCHSRAGTGDWSGWWQHRPLLLGLGLVWLAHIGLDRLMGYGLKYGDTFSTPTLACSVEVAASPRNRPDPDQPRVSVSPLRAIHLQLDVRIEAVAVEQTEAPVFAGLGDEGIDLVLRLGSR